MDGRDFLLWQRSDPNSAVITTAGGLEGWQTNYGVVVEPLPASQAIPEPTSLVLIAMGAFGIFARRR